MKRVKRPRRPYRYGPPGKTENVPYLCHVILITLAGLAKHFEKRYCWPSQKRILALLEKFHKVSICRSTLNRGLTWLVENGYIRRKRRHRRIKTSGNLGTDGHMLACSTLYQIEAKGFNYLRSLTKSILDLFSHFKVPRWDREKMLAGTSTIFKSIRKFLAGQEVPAPVVKAAFSG